jgi:hypothetical protein
MDRQFQKVVGSASGIGKLYEKSKFIDDVSYEYSIMQTFMEIQSQSGNQIVPGIKELNGKVELKGDGRSLSGNMYCLETSEGVLFDIIIHNGDYVKKRYDFTKAAV